MLLVFILEIVPSSQLQYLSNLYPPQTKQVKPLKYTLLRQEPATSESRMWPCFYWSESLNSFLGVNLFQHTRMAVAYACWNFVFELGNNNNKIQWVNVTAFWVC